MLSSNLHPELSPSLENPITCCGCDVAAKGIWKVGEALLEMWKHKHWIQQLNQNKFPQLGRLPKDAGSLRPVRVAETLLDVRC